MVLLALGPSAHRPMRGFAGNLKTRRAGYGVVTTLPFAESRSSSSAGLAKSPLVELNVRCVAGTVKDLIKACCAIG
jgi:hypothetical protein